MDFLRVLCFMILMSSLLLLGFPVEETIAQESFTPPSITFKKLDDDGCKIFGIDDGDGGQIRRVNVFAVGSIEKPPTIAPPAKRTSDAINDTFEYDKGKEPGVAELKVCPKDGIKNVVFGIDVETTKDLDFGLVVQELETKAGKETSGEVVGTFSIDKNNAKCNSLKIKGDNFVETEKTRCFTSDKGTSIIVIGKQMDLNKPAVVAVSIDPPSKMHLLVLEACITLDNETISCPSDVPLDFVIAFPKFFVNGELLKLDTTALFLAGFQSVTVWLVPTLTAILGAGTIYYTKYRQDKN